MHGDLEPEERVLEEDIEPKPKEEQETTES